MGVRWATWLSSWGLRKGHGVGGGGANGVAGEHALVNQVGQGTGVGLGGARPPAEKSALAPP